MEIKFQNGSKIVAIDTHEETKRSKAKEAFYNAGYSEEESNELAYIAMSYENDMALYSTDEATNYLINTLRTETNALSEMFALN
jgi:predicted HAD superfamily Cof-like phosphohydrolase